MTEEPERQDLAAYALGLLEDPSRAAVEAHVRSCLDCAEELGAYRAAIALLPYAQRAEQAPTEAWEAIAARIRRRSGSEVRETAGGSWWPGRWLGAMRRFQPALTATLAAAVIGLIAWNVTLQSRVSENHYAAPVLGSAAGETAAALFGVGQSGANGLAGYLIMSKDQRQGGLLVNGLRVLPSGRSYQVWFVRPDQSRASAGTFRVDSRGEVVKLVAVPQPADEFDGVAITEEPAGGSPTPTGHDLLAGPIYEK